jgi:hypothetical protein
MTGRRMISHLPGIPTRNRANLASPHLTLQPDLRPALHRAIRSDSKIQF